MSGSSSGGKQNDGKATAGTGSSTDDFGNTNTTETGGAGTSAADGGTCEEGFCAPTEPDPEGCGNFKLKADVTEIKKPGNVLVIFDRSGSMEQDWNGKPRYESAGNALIAALDPLKDLLTVGGVFFPSLGDTGSCDCGNWVNWVGGCCLTLSAGACTVTTIDQPDQISFRPAPAFITELPNQWLLQGGGGTPLDQGVKRGAEALASMTFTDPVTVVILTDGEPTCGSDNQSVVDQVTAWHAMGIDTHVVGLPGSEGAKTLLTQLAQVGGTTDYIDPADPTALQTELSKVFTSTIKVGFDSCTIHLDPAAEAPEKLHLVATQGGVEQDVPRDLSKDASWNVNAAGDTVTLEGQLCTMAKEGKFEALDFQYGCVDLPPLPPPPPVE